MFGDLEEIRAGSKPGPVNQELMEAAVDCPKGREVPKESVWDRERSGKGITRIPHDF